MPAKTRTHAQELRAKQRLLLSTAGAALAQPLALAAGFKDAKAFKAGLIKSLAAHTDFDRAAHDLHDLHSRALASLRGSQIPASVRPHDRIQASRYDPSQGQTDRQRGHRAPGGRREGQRSYKGPS